MEPKKMAAQKNEIYKLLANPGNMTVVLYGEPGVGKTWIAREVSRIVKLKNKFDFVVWVYLNRDYNNDTLRDCITQQLSLLPNYGISEVEEDDEKSKESKMDEVLNLEALEKKLKNKKILLVLDDEGTKLKEQTIRDRLLGSLKLVLQTYQVLVTTRNDPTTNNSTNGRSYVRVKPMVRDESLALLKERAFPYHQIDDDLAKVFLERTKGIPSSIVIMAKAFNYFFDKEGDGAVLLRRSLREPFDDKKLFNITDLMRSGYDLVPYNILIDCQRDAYDGKFFTSRCINHNELISYWIMEGYLGHVSCMETAYRKGHEILMELLDFQVLKRVEADYVTINPLGEEFDDYLLRRENKHYRRGYYGNAFLGLDSVFGSVNWEGLVQLSHKGGVMRTLPSRKKGKKVCALLLDGNSLTKKLINSITSLKELQVLCVFNPTEDMLSHFKDNILEKLHVFVLRSYWLVKNMDQVNKIEKFENLTVLEISGPSSWSEFSDDIFKKTPNLQSLNLSFLPITKLPSSAYELGELKWLILRDCTLLESLESLKNYKNLVVLDCSGSKSLKSIGDARFTNLKLNVINLSGTNMKSLPLVSTLKKLTHLMLSDCHGLNRLRSFTGVTSLEIIDLSNSKSFGEFFDQSMEKLVNLKILDLSGTSVKKIPRNICNPRHLYLENCTKLTEDGVLECLTKAQDLEVFVLSNAGIPSLPSISHLTNLRKLVVTDCLNLEAVPELSSLEKIEELDFSGCKLIDSIPDNSFDKMSLLQELNLSHTSIESLPSLANLLNLRRLLLKDCEKLKSLPLIETNSLEKLEELNLSGGKALRNIELNFFNKTINLHILDLSDVPLGKLPSLSGLVNLCELYLKNCKGLKSVPGLETLTSLEILDLSESAVSDLPLLSKLTKLRKLMLHNCSSLSLFREKGTLNLLGAHVQNLPYGISKLSSLEQLDLPSINDIQGDDSYEKSDGFEWAISSLFADVAPNENRPFVTVSGTQFLEPFVKDHKLWESSLKKFHLSVYPVKELDAKSLPHFLGDDFVYRDVYIRIKQFGGESEKQRLLEVYGFSDYTPVSMDVVFSQANLFSFIYNKYQELNKEGKKFETRPPFLSACKSKQIDGFWIENYIEIKDVFSESEFDKLLNLIKILGVSNATSLKSIVNSNGKPPDYLVFQNLETLYLDCCPNLPTVLSFSQLPQKLKTLHIKFCDNLSEVFKGFESTQAKTLKFLETLHLWELPKLESLGCQFPSLKTLEVSNCPKLRKLEETIASAEALKNLSISNVHDLKSILVSKGLENLSINSCPQIEEITIQSHPPSNLRMCIRYCRKLETLFEDISLEFVLEKLHLNGLPKLRVIGAKIPNQENRFIVDCPRLGNF